MRVLVETNVPRIASVWDISTTEKSRCWIAYDLQTLTKVANSKQVGYIKVPN